MVPAHISFTCQIFSCVYKCVWMKCVCVRVYMCMCDKMRGRQLTLINSCFLPFLARPRRVSSSCSSGTFRSDIRFMSPCCYCCRCSWTGQTKLKSEKKTARETLKREFFVSFFFCVSFSQCRLLYIQIAREWVRASVCGRRERKKNERKSERPCGRPTSDFFFFFFSEIDSFSPFFHSKLFCYKNKDYRLGSKNK